ncbi:MAG: hypothetical protein ACYCV5_11200 [Acidimicrobiales bacterium]
MTRHLAQRGLRNDNAAVIGAVTAALCEVLACLEEKGCSNRSPPRGAR